MTCCICHIPTDREAWVYVGENGFKVAICEIHPLEQVEIEVL